MEVPAEIIEDRAAARLSRKSVLSREFPPELSVIIDEPAPRGPVGGAEVMRWQLEHLVTMAARPHISIQVVPTARGAHPGVAGPFVLLEFAAAPAIVHLENRTSSLFLEDPGDIRSYRELITSLTRLALSPEESREFVASLAREGT
jgi:Domain of unknown function (DUF5753)